MPRGGEWVEVEQSGGEVQVATAPATQSGTARARRRSGRVVYGLVGLAAVYRLATLGSVRRSSPDHRVAAA